MKRLLAVFGMLMCAASQAKVVVLDCSGTETYSITGKSVSSTLEITFDDESNEIISMPSRLWSGCVSDEPYKSTGCKIKITKSVIRVDSSTFLLIEGTDRGDVQSLIENSVEVNRYTGKMKWHEHRSQKIAETGAPASKEWFVVGMLECKAYTTPKF